ncbi:hypothetical protein WAI453_008289 [Rhynchosporium graminicola]|uniref:Uncharacterized protein n=1 Tax=Rhynchosporium graminicola TaxID=2792576 RepID=A0A1E1KMI5_9HELO|nr:uncharacterized protein RCO7_00527 [Rhynchosporium commune]
MSLKKLMEQFQVMLDRRAAEDLERGVARFMEDADFEATKRMKLKSLEAEVSKRIPSYESRSNQVLKNLKREQEHDTLELHLKHKAQVRALQKKHEEEMVALPEKYKRKAADIEKNLRMDMQWELDLMLKVEQSSLEQKLMGERRRALETREREDKIREQARALVDQDTNSQVLTTFREEAARQAHPHLEVAAQIPSQRTPLKSILKKSKARSVTVNSEGAITFLTEEDETLDDRKTKRVKVEGASKRDRVVDVLDEEATLFPYRENIGPSNQNLRSPRTPRTPRTPWVSSWTPRNFSTSEEPCSSSSTSPT